MEKYTGNLPRRHIGVTDIDSMEEMWRVEFEREVGEGNFVAGGNSLVLFGYGQKLAMEQWVACLLLAGMHAYLTDPVEILRRLRSEYVPRNTEALTEEFNKAEALFIRGFFLHDHRSLNAEDMSLLHWFMEQAIDDGVVLVVGSDRDSDTGGLYQNEALATLLDEHFEAIHVKKTKNTKK